MDTEQDKDLSREQSLELIASMISQAKCNYYDTGISALLWGSVVIFCSLATYANQSLHWPVLRWVWLLIIVAVVPQVIISARENKQRGYKTREGALMAGIWFSYGVAMFVFSYVDSYLNIAHDVPIYLTLFGIPTFATGFGRQFKPMIFGGIACWVFAIVTLYARWPDGLFFMAGGALLAWFIPGLILRQRYLDAKRQHV
jgi:hypothetical protein